MSLKVFISSVIQGFEEYRDAAESAAKSLRHSVVRAEDFGARAESPQVACLSAAREADVVVLLLGARYGALQPSGLSATHEEYREIRDRKPVLAFIQVGVAFEPLQEKLARDVRAWESGHMTADFHSPTSLRDGVTAALRDLELTQAGTPFDEAETAQRAQAVIRQEIYGPQVVVSVASGPRQQVLRPKQLTAPLSEVLQREAMFGANRIFSQEERTVVETKGTWLWLRQETAALALDPLGTVVAYMPAIPKKARNSLVAVLVEEYVQDRIGTAIQFATYLLDQVDSTIRLSHSVIVVALLESNYLGWLTQAEANRNPTSITLDFTQGPQTAQLSPPSRRRQDLRLKSVEIAEDLTTLLKRARRQ